jgi:hypothetical protein
MSTSEIAPGWHPDPANPSGSLRWWDGTRWTDQTQPARATGGAPDSSWTGMPMSYGGTATPRPSSVSRASNVSFAHQNQRSLTAIGFAALYVVVAMTTHVVFLGIIPAMAAYRAIQRKEPLAWVGVAAAAVAIAMSVAGLA